ncbi:MAG: zinc-ribbon domain-containing protein [Chloroflexi bacterium]|nr:zinc-ribbon domain-containing protein [Chloroflexota bacterium]
MQDDERDQGDAPAEQLGEPAEQTTETEQPPDTEQPTEPAQEAQPAQAPSEAEAWVVPPPPAPSNPDLIPAHPVPATPLSEGTVCPRCGTDNRPGIAFCRSCGQRLMAPGAPAAVERPSPPEGSQACPRCGTHNRAGVPFCQNCGANLRPSETAAEPALTPAATTASTIEAPRRAVLGPVVLLIGAVGIMTGWLLPFAFGGASLWDRSYGAPGGYGVGFWQGYPDGPISETAYFGLAAPVPILVALLVILAVAGVLRAAPGMLQRIGLLVALVWTLALVALFLVVELLGGPGGDLIGVLRALSPGGIIFLLAGLIVAIGTLTRLWRA